MPSRLLLVVDPDPALIARLRPLAESFGLECLEARDAQQAAQVLETTRVDAVIAAPEAAVVTNLPRIELHATEQAWSDAAGATPERKTVDSISTQHDDATWRHLFRRLASKPRDLSVTTTGRGWIGRSASSETLRDRLQRLAPLDESVWFEGESGAGKRWCAQQLHRWSSHSEEPFVVIGAADLNTQGWERRWMADDGQSSNRRRTIYLDEPANFEPASIARLTAVLQQAPANRWRLVSGSTQRLDRVVEEGRLPAVLAAQLAAVRLTVAPLRDRVEDVGPLVKHFLEEISAVNQLPPQRLSADVLDRLEGYAWPGNVRELRHAIEHATILAQDEIDLPHLPRAVREEAPLRSAASSGGDIDLERSFRDAKREVVTAFEARYLAALMERQRGNVTAAAKEAGMLRSALQRLLRKHELKSADFRRSRSAVDRRAARPVETDLDAD